MTTVAVQTQARDQFLALQPDPFGRYHKCADEGFLADFHRLVGGKERHQVLAGDAARRPPRAGRLRHVEAGPQVHMLPQELVLQVGLAQPVKVTEEVLARLLRHAGITFVRALAELIWNQTGIRSLLT